MSRLFWNREYKWRETARLIGLEVPHWKAHALDYLESVGLEFCVDFGTENAMEKARQHYAAHKHEWSVQ